VSAWTHLSAQAEGCESKKSPLRTAGLRGVQEEQMLKKSECERAAKNQTARRAISKRRVAEPSGLQLQSSILNKWIYADKVGMIQDVNGSRVEFKADMLRELDLFVNRKVPNVA